MAYIVIEQGAVVEREDGARVFAGFGVPKQLAGHAEMDIENATVEIDEDLLAATANVADDAAGERVRGFGEVRASHAMRRELRAFDAMPNKMRSDGAYNSFDFGQFRQDYFHDSGRPKRRTGGLN